MASDNLMMMEQPWMFRPTFSDAWISDMFTKETDTFAKALQHSFSPASSADGDAFSAEMVESLFAPPPIQMPTASGGSENEAPPQKPRRGVAPSGGGGRIAKRKSRASKRATTTFITADPANFRQMVQQVTGVRFTGLNGQLPVSPVVKPEPLRAINRLQPSTAFDAAAFFLDGSSASLVAPPSTVVADGGASATGLDFDSFCSFPTLESWKVM